MSGHLPVFATGRDWPRPVAGISGTGAVPDLVAARYGIGPCTGLKEDGRDKGLTVIAGCSALRPLRILSQVASKGLFDDGVSVHAQPTELVR